MQIKLLKLIIFKLITIIITYLDSGLLANGLRGIAAGKEKEKLYNN